MLLLTGLGAAHGQLVDVLDRKFAPERGRPEMQLPVGRRQPRVAHDRAHHRAAEGLVEEGIAHHADVGLLPHLGDGGGLQRTSCAPRRVSSQARASGMK